MKKLTLILISLILIGATNQVLAAKEAKGVRHCGCIYVATNETDGEASMVYQDLLVAGRSKGHRNHVIGSEDDCLSGYEWVTPIEGEDYLSPLYEAFVREGDDCMWSGTDPFILACDLDIGPEEGDVCGSLAP